jgi:hypothetical protein
MRVRGLFVVGIVGLSGAVGCAGFTPAHLGQVAGTIVGAAIAPGIGAPLGALIGMLTGSAMQHGMDKQTEARERVDLHEQLKTGHVSQTAPVASSSAASLAGTPTRVWVDETQQGGRFSAGHFEVRSVP